MTQNDNTPHLLVIRLSAMGDVAMTVPVLKALRQAHPDLRITVLTRAFFRPFFREVENLDFMDCDFKGRHKGIAGIIRLKNDINACGITHVADLHDVLRTKILCHLLKISGKEVVSIDKGRSEKRELTRKFRKEVCQLKTSVERYSNVIRELGFEFPDPQPMQSVKYPVPEEISKMVGEKNSAWVGVAPFAKHKGKIYPTSQMDELIGILSEKYDRVFIFGGGPYEKEFAEYMDERYESAYSVIDKIKLKDELALISNLDAMVTMDSSAMHMASLVGVPAVSIWGATHPYAGFYGFGQDPNNAIQLDMHCRPCSVYGNKPCLYNDYRCMTGISPRSVLEKILSLTEHTADISTIEDAKNNNKPAKKSRK